MIKEVPLLMLKLLLGPQNRSVLNIIEVPPFPSVLIRERVPESYT